MELILLDRKAQRKYTTTQVAQVAVGRKENEFKQAPHLLQQVSLSGTIVVGDAMQTQRELSQQIVDAGGDYL